MGAQDIQKRLLAEYSRVGAILRAWRRYASCENRWIRIPRSSRCRIQVYSTVIWKSRNLWIEWGQFSQKSKCHVRRYQKLYIRRIDENRVLHFSYIYGALIQNYSILYTDWGLFWRIGMQKYWKLDYAIERSKFGNIENLAVVEMSWMHRV